MNSNEASKQDPGMALFGKLAVPVIPVIRIDAAETAVGLARALVASGLDYLEITLRTPAACAAIERIAAEVPDAVVGAGTVLNAQDFDRVIHAGARFAIAPGCTDTLYRDSADAPIPLIPGVATISEVMLGMEHGHQMFKFFPAEAAGGPAMLKAWAGPLPAVRFVPTGGISLERARAYLGLPNVLSVGGSWMLPEDAMAARDWTRSEALARACATLTSPA
jgi:2-dehydro-3-deoxyphosphogluconate aldolase / (4S)-4-hydroxy-2-oxoglutarate aldolase